MQSEKLAYSVKHKMADKSKFQFTSFSSNYSNKFFTFLIAIWRYNTKPLTFIEKRHSDMFRYPIDANHSAKKGRAA
jgi:hypothetical protein